MSDAFEKYSDLAYDPTELGSGGYIILAPRSIQVEPYQRVFIEPLLNLNLEEGFAAFITPIDAMLFNSSLLVQSNVIFGPYSAPLRVEAVNVSLPDFLVTESASQLAQSQFFGSINKAEFFPGDPIFNVNIKEIG